MNYFEQNLTENQMSLIKQLDWSGYQEPSEKELTEKFCLLENAIILLENELLLEKKKKNGLIIFDMQTNTTEISECRQEEVIEEFKRQKTNKNLAYAYIVHKHFSLIPTEFYEEKEIVQINLLLKMLK